MMQGLKSIKRTLQGPLAKRCDPEGDSSRPRKYPSPLTWFFLLMQKGRVILRTNEKVNPLRILKETSRLMGSSAGPNQRRKKKCPTHRRLSRK
jgi:hypothetical protein